MAGQRLDPPEGDQRAFKDRHRHAGAREQRCRRQSAEPGGDDDRLETARRRRGRLRRGCPV
jgi:hypothetical protein